MNIGVDVNNSKINDVLGELDLNDSADGDFQTSGRAKHCSGVC